MINFLLIRSWQTLLRIDRFALVSPKVVVQQIKGNHTRATIQKAIAAGSLHLVDEQIPASHLESLPNWVLRFGEQDAAVLVNALALNCWIGADDRGLCNEATRLGTTKIIGTEGLLAELVVQRHISLPQGNNKLKLLRQHRYEPHVPCLCALCGVACLCS